MNAKEYFTEQYGGEHIPMIMGLHDIDSMYVLIDEYATLREQEAFEAGYMARKKMQSSGNYKPQHESFKEWRESK